MTDSITKGTDTDLVYHVFFSKDNRDIMEVIRDTADGVRDITTYILDTEQGTLSVSSETSETPIDKILDIRSINSKIKKTNKPWYNSFNKKKY